MSPSFAKGLHLIRIRLSVRGPKRSVPFLPPVPGLDLVRSVTEGNSAGRAQRTSDARLVFEAIFTEVPPPGDYLTRPGRVSFELPSGESVDRAYKEAGSVTRANSLRVYEGSGRFLASNQMVTSSPFSRGLEMGPFSRRPGLTRLGGRGSLGDATARWSR
jgi:hypothetical protein